jgi:prolyl-tRNA synthetase
MLDCYRELAEEWLCIPVVPGRKTESEKFAGAEYTLSIEAMMSDGWALQAGTSHQLGQNFTRAYGISYSDRENALQHPFQTSWGLSTRIIGGLIMAHGDDSGLVMPPRVAPIQVVVVPVTRSNDAEGAAAVEAACARLEAGAGEVRLRVDRREGIRPGEKYAHWELRGVPLRVTVGARDLAAGAVTLTRRVDGESWTEPLEGVAGRLPALLEEAHTRTWARAETMLRERTVEVSSLEELGQTFAGEPVFANAPFCERPGCEEAVKAAAHALSVRVLRRDRSGERGRCLACGEASSEVALIARAY